MQLDESKMRRGVMSFDRSYQVPFLIEILPSSVRPGRDDPHASQRALPLALRPTAYRARAGDAPTFLVHFTIPVSAGCAQEKVIKPRLAPGPPMELS